MEIDTDGRWVGGAVSFSTDESEVEVTDMRYSTRRSGEPDLT